MTTKGYITKKIIENFFELYLLVKEDKPKNEIKEKVEEIGCQLEIGQMILEKESCKEKITMTKEELNHRTSQAFMRGCKKAKAEAYREDEQCQK